MNRYALALLLILSTAWLAARISGQRPGERDEQTDRGRRTDARSLRPGADEGFAMSNVKTISDDELRDMRDRFGEIKRGPLDPANERDRHAIAGIVPMMIELLDEVLRLRGDERRIEAMAALFTRQAGLSGYLYVFAAPIFRETPTAEDIRAAIDAAIRRSGVAAPGAEVDR